MERKLSRSHPISQKILETSLELHTNTRPPLVPAIESGDIRIGILSSSNSQLEYCVLSA